MNSTQKFGSGLRPEPRQGRAAPCNPQAFTRFTRLFSPRHFFLVPPLDASYYGYRDDEDGILEKLEKSVQKKMRAEALEEWKSIDKEKQEARSKVKSGEVAEVGAAQQILREEEEDVVEEERRMELEREAKEKEFVVHVPLPDEKEIERMVVSKKQQELLSKYATDNLVEEQTEAKAMLNIHR